MKNSLKKLRGLASTAIPKHGRHRHNHHHLRSPLSKLDDVTQASQVHLVLLVSTISFLLHSFLFSWFYFYLIWCGFFDFVLPLQIYPSCVSHWILFCNTHYWLPLSVFFFFADFIYGIGCLGDLMYSLGEVWKLDLPFVCCCRTCKTWEIAMTAYYLLQQPPRIVLMVFILFTLSFSVFNFRCCIMSLTLKLN